MFKTLLLGVLACGAMLTGCAADTTPLDTSAPGSVKEPADSVVPTFEVRLGGTMSQEDVITAILAAGHDQLVTACAADPGASIRVVSPLAAGDVTELACSTALADGSTSQAGAPLTTERESTGQTQQKIGPISLVACGLFAAGSFLFLNEVLCPRATSPQDRENCAHVGNFGGAAITILCAIPF